MCFFKLISVVVGEKVYFAEYVNEEKVDFNVLGGISDLFARFDVKGPGTSTLFTLSKQQLNSKDAVEIPEESTTINW